MSVNLTDFWIKVPFTFPELKSILRFKSVFFMGFRSIRTVIIITLPRDKNNLGLIKGVQNDTSEESSIGWFSVCVLCLGVICILRISDYFPDFPNLKFDLEI